MELLKSNLQFFAEEGADDGAPTPSEDEDKKTEVDVVDEEDESEKEGEEKLFTQAELEEKVKARLARERRKQDEERQKEAEKAEADRLEKQGEFKELLEKERAKVAEFEKKEAQQEKRNKIVEEFKTHGLNQEQAESKVKWVEKAIETDDDIKEVVSEFAGEFKTETYAEPSAGFGKTKKAEPQDDEEYGQKMLDRVRGLTKTKYQ